MGAAAKLEGKGEAVVSSEMVEFVDVLAELLAAEFIKAQKEASDAGSGLREVLEREPAGAEHRGSDPGL
ncbi:MAG: hypothetical protein JNL21_32890 [Myxococcales bacterium]|nr:hypothetical protein [Myxococcales bacterium]